MSLRISSAALLCFAIAGCGDESSGAAGDPIECAIGPGAEYSPVCTIEQSNGGFITHYPGGGFRRFTIDRDSASGLTTDGAQILRIENDGSNSSMVVVVVGEDRYRLDRRMIEPDPDD